MIEPFVTPKREIVCVQGVEQFSNYIGVVNMIYFANWSSECNNKMHRLHQFYVLEGIVSVYYVSEVCNLLPMFLRWK